MRRNIETEYKDIAATSGRIVANRWLHAKFRQADPKYPLELPDFYKAHGPEMTSFDPFGWYAHYRDHPADRLSPIYNLTDGASAHWHDQLVGAREFWGSWVIGFLYLSLVLEESHEALDSIADDQGEFVSVDGDADLCAWFPGWKGWTAWAKSLSDDDLLTLRLVLSRDFRTKYRHPEPGSPEAGAFMSTCNPQESAKPGSKQ
ncbi:hypothetical protein WK73_04510 [Burkholderia ubonensis]|uniref:hypothetical protein n=1 Tax=Burkholderia ubonensis TaxID=101571 RepID=UPI00075C0B7B|nr:hypothetical protein [Burkholderia ubonensis]KVU80063.1 hypothetical protein WK73_04510 [Burkholderia ubonensis]